MKVEENLQGLNWFEHEQPWVLFYFSTSWCAPCQKMAPVMAEISKQYAEHLNVVKIDVDEQITLAKKYGVKGVPTLVLLDKPGNHYRLVGGVSARQVRDWLDTQLSFSNTFE